MSRTARLFQLMQALRSLPPPATARALSDMLEVTPRTVYRDIDALRGLGAVIDGEAGFGYTLIEDAALPPLGFEDDEIEALVLGLREVQVTADPALASAAKTALSKLKARLPARQSHRLQHAVLDARRIRTRPKPVINVKQLRKAAWDELSVRITYADVHGAQTERQVDPLGIVFLDESNVLLGWCHLRQDFRVFRLDRIAALQVTDQSFRPRRVPMLRDHLARIRRDIEVSARDRTRAE